jgi:hydrogenase-4 component E
MNTAADLILIFLILSNLSLLGLSRLGTCIRVVALQGVALGLLPLCMSQSGPALHQMLFSAFLIGLKGIVFPWVLMKTLREIKIQREIEPFVGYGASIVLGTAALVISMWLGRQLPLPIPIRSGLIVPAAFFTIMSGLFLIIARKKALTQILGYLVLENGIYTFGAALTEHQPVLIELGILLDIFAAVLVMGIAIFHINREFDHIDTDKLSGLRT